MHNDSENHESLIERLEADALLAHATACAVAGCDGTSHNAGDDADDWHHQLAAHSSGVIDWELNIDPHGRAYGYVAPTLDGAELDTEGLLSLAEQYELVPAMLRALAAEVERRNA